MINLSLINEVQNEDGPSCGHRMLEDTTNDIVSNNALWADFQKRCRMSKKGHTNYNTHQILAEFMEERNREREAKRTRTRCNETASLDGDCHSLGEQSLCSIDSFRSNPEHESNSNLFQVAAHTTRQFRRTTMEMITNTFEDSSSVSSCPQNQPSQKAPHGGRHQRSTMPMVSNYVMTGGNSRSETQNTNSSPMSWSRSSSMGHGAPSHNLPERSIYDMALEAVPNPSKISRKATNIKVPSLYNRQSSITLEEATDALAGELQRLSSVGQDSSTGNVSTGSKNSSVTSLVGKFVERTCLSLANEELV
jgi:hypothetical protein